jgi:excisionase family DNA binding protein
MKKDEISIEDARKRAALTVDEFASLTGTSTISIYRHTKSDKIPAIRLGGRVMIPRTYFAQFIGG